MHDFAPAAIDCALRFPCRVRYLMCRPQYFSVSYVIDPWMAPAEWAANETRHRQQSRRDLILNDNRRTEAMAKVRVRSQQTSDAIDNTPTQQTVKSAQNDTFTGRRRMVAY
jgi:hypothetical protein